MTQEIIIGLAVAIALALTIGIKSLAHRLLTFKMDESAIVNFFKASSAEFTSCSTEAIAAATDISVRRVALVCEKSKLIQKNAKEDHSWCLR